RARPPVPAGLVPAADRLLPAAGGRRQAEAEGAEVHGGAEAGDAAGQPAGRGPGAGAQRQDAAGRPGAAGGVRAAGLRGAGSAGRHPGCGDGRDVQDLRRGVEAPFVRCSHARRHDRDRAVLLLDLDLSPLPASGAAAGSERCSMGRCRSKTGRKLVRGRASQYQATVWEEVLPGRTVEPLAVVQQAVQAAERLLDLEGDGEEAAARRARPEWRLDGGWGTAEILNWLLGRGEQVAGTFTSTSWVRKLVRPITAWQAPSSPGREVAAVPDPVAMARPCAPDAVRTPSKDQPGDSSHAVLPSSRRELGMQGLVRHDDDRAGMEADLKNDTRGLGLGALRTRKLAAQRRVVLLGQRAHTVLVWARRWLADSEIVRLVQDVWAVPGRVKRLDDGGLPQLLPGSRPLGLLGETLATADGEFPSSPPVARSPSRAAVCCGVCVWCRGLGHPGHQAHAALGARTRTCLL